MSGIQQMMKAVSRVGGSPQAQCFNLGTVFNSNATSTLAQMQLLRDARILTKRGSAASINAGNYVASGATATIGDLYEAFVHQVSGDVLDVNAGLESWVTISVTRTWNYNSTPGDFESGSFTYQVREIADPSNISAVCTFTLETEDGS